jgi:hypothetical protein
MLGCLDFLPRIPILEHVPEKFMLGPDARISSSSGTGAGETIGAVTPEPPPLSDISFHKVPLGRRVVGGLVATFVGFLAVASMFVPLVLLGSLTAVYVAAPALVIFGHVGNAALRRAARGRDEYRVDRTGIVRRRRKGEETELRWTEISKVRLRAMPTRLEILDLKGKVVFQMDSSLTGFADLLPLIGTMVHASKESEPAAVEEFQHGRFRWLLLATPPLWAGISLTQYGGILFLVWLVSAVQVAFWLFGWSTVRVEESSFVVTRPFRSERIGAEEIAFVGLLADEHGRRMSASVSVFLTDDRILSFSGVTGGQLPLFLRLVRLWKSTAETAATEQDPGEADGSQRAGATFA